MIDRFYTTSVDVSRMALQPDGESTALTVVGTISCHVQQARVEFAQQVGEAWGRTFIFWCPVNTDIKSGDTLTIASGAYAGTYNLSDVQINAVGRNQHLQCVAIKDVT
jgi:hypothetical protein